MGRTHTVFKNCWIWQGRINKYGYGIAKHNGKTIHAHRFAYLMFYGSIPPGMVVHHTCKNKACVNPKHLKPLTASEHTTLHMYEEHGKGWSSQTIRRQKMYKDLKKNRCFSTGDR